MFMETLAEFELSPAASFAMAQHARHGHIDPPPDAWLSSQDTVEDLDLYKDQLCVPPDAKQSDTNLSSTKTLSAQASPLTAVEVIAIKAQMQELERIINSQDKRISALEEHNKLLERTLADFEECFDVLGQKIRKRKQGRKDKDRTKVENGDDLRTKNMKRVRFM